MKRRLALIPHGKQDLLCKALIETNYQVFNITNLSNSFYAAGNRALFRTVWIKYARTILSHSRIENTRKLITLSLSFDEIVGLKLRKITNKWRYKTKWRIYTRYILQAKLKEDIASAVPEINQYRRENRREKWEQFAHYILRDQQNENIIQEVDKINKGKLVKKCFDKLVEEYNKRKCIRANRKAKWEDLMDRYIQLNNQKLLRTIMLTDQRKKRWLEWTGAFHRKLVSDSLTAAFSKYSNYKLWKNIYRNYLSKLQHKELIKAHSNYIYSTKWFNLVYDYCAQSQYNALKAAKFHIDTIDTMNRFVLASLKQKYASDLIKAKEDLDHELEGIRAHDNMIRMFKVWRDKAMFKRTSKRHLRSDFQNSLQCYIENVAVNSAVIIQKFLRKQLEIADRKATNLETIRRCFFKWKKTSKPLLSSTVTFPQIVTIVKPTIQFNLDRFSPSLNVDAIGVTKEIIFVSEKTVERMTNSVSKAASKMIPLSLPLYETKNALDNITPAQPAIDLMHDQQMKFLDTIEFGITFDPENPIISLSENEVRKNKPLDALAPVYIPGANEIFVDEISQIAFNYKLHTSFVNKGDITPLSEFETKPEVDILSVYNSDLYNEEYISDNFESIPRPNERPIEHAKPSPLPINVDFVDEVIDVIRLDRALPSIALSITDKINPFISISKIEERKQEVDEDLPIEAIGWINLDILKPELEKMIDDNVLLRSENVDFLFYDRSIHEEALDLLDLDAIYDESFLPSTKPLENIVKADNNLESRISIDEKAIEDSIMSVLTPDIIDFNVDSLTKHIPYKYVEKEEKYDYMPTLSFDEIKVNVSALRNITKVERPSIDIMKVDTLIRNEIYLDLPMYIIKYYRRIYNYVHDYEKSNNEVDTSINFTPTIPDLLPIVQRAEETLTEALQKYSICGPSPEIHDNKEEMIDYATADENVLNLKFAENILGAKVKPITIMPQVGDIKLDEIVYPEINFLSDASFVMNSTRIDRVLNNLIRFPHSRIPKEGDYYVELRFDPAFICVSKVLLRALPIEVPHFKATEEEINEASRIVYDQPKNLEGNATEKTLSVFNRIEPFIREQSEVPEYEITPMFDFTVLPAIKPLLRMEYNRSLPKVSFEPEDFNMKEIFGECISSAIESAFGAVEKALFEDKPEYEDDTVDLNELANVLDQTLGFVVDSCTIESVNLFENAMASIQLKSMEQTANEIINEFLLSATTEAMQSVEQKEEDFSFKELLPVLDEALSVTINDIFAIQANDFDQGIGRTIEEKLDSSVIVEDLLKEVTKEAIFTVLEEIEIEVISEKEAESEKFAKQENAEEEEEEETTKEEVPIFEDELLLQPISEALENAIKENIASIVTFDTGFTEKVEEVEESEFESESESEKKEDEIDVRPAMEEIMKLSFKKIAKFLFINALETPLFMITEIPKVEPASAVEEPKKVEEEKPKSSEIDTTEIREALSKAIDEAAKEGALMSIRGIDDLLANQEPGEPRKELPKFDTKSISQYLVDNINRIISGSPADSIFGILNNLYHHQIIRIHHHHRSHKGEKPSKIEEETAANLIWKSIFESTKEICKEQIKENFSLFDPESVIKIPLDEKTEDKEKIEFETTDFESLFDEALIVTLKNASIPNDILIIKNEEKDETPREIKGSKKEEIDFKDSISDILNSTLKTSLEDAIIKDINILVPFDLVVVKEKKEEVPESEKKDLLELSESFDKAIAETVGNACAKAADDVNDVMVLFTELPPMPKKEENIKVYSMDELDHSIKVAIAESVVESFNQSANSVIELLDIFGDFQVIYKEKKKVQFHPESTMNYVKQTLSEVINLFPANAIFNTVVGLDILPKRTRPKGTHRSHKEHSHHNQKKEKPKKEETEMGKHLNEAIESCVLSNLQFTLENILMDPITEIKAQPNYRPDFDQALTEAFNDMFGRSISYSIEDADFALSRIEQNIQEAEVEEPKAPEINPIKKEKPKEEKEEKSMKKEVDLSTVSSLLDAAFSSCFYFAADIDTNTMIFMRPLEEEKKKDMATIKPRPKGKEEKKEDGLFIRKEAEKALEEAFGTLSFAPTGFEDSFRVCCEKLSQEKKSKGGFDRIVEEYNKLSNKVISVTLKNLVVTISASIMDSFDAIEPVTHSKPKLVKLTGKEDMFPYISSSIDMSCKAVVGNSALDGLTRIQILSWMPKKVHHRPHDKSKSKPKSNTKFEVFDCSEALKFLSKNVIEGSLENFVVRPSAVEGGNKLAETAQPRNKASQKRSPANENEALTKEFDKLYSQSLRSISADALSALIDSFTIKADLFSQSH